MANLLSVVCCLLSSPPMTTETPAKPRDFIREIVEDFRQLASHKNIQVETKGWGGHGR